MMHKMNTSHRSRTRRRVVAVAVGCLVLAFTSVAGASEPFRPEYGLSSWGRGFGWAGVFTPDLSGFDVHLEANGFGALDGSLALYGGGGFGAWDTWRAGGFGGGGHIRSIRGDKRAELNVGFGLAEVMRVWPVAGMYVEAGALFGGGGATLLLSEGSPGSTSDAFADRHATLIDRGFFLGGPTVGLGIDLGDHFGLRLTAGHLQTFGGSWVHRGDQTMLAGLPDFSGSFVSVGVTMGGRRPQVQ